MPWAYRGSDRHCKKKHGRYNEPLSGQRCICAVSLGSLWTYCRVEVGVYAIIPCLGFCGIGEPRWYHTPSNLSPIVLHISKMRYLRLESLSWQVLVYTVYALTICLLLRALHTSRCNELKLILRYQWKLRLHKHPHYMWSMSTCAVLEMKHPIWWLLLLCSQW